MSPLKRLKKAASDTFFKTRLFVRYGSTRPNHAKLPGCEHPVYFDPDDPCAFKKILKASLRDRVSNNLVFWREFNAHLKPDLCIDVGLSYGECLFGTTYADFTRLHGFEANPRLIDYLEESRRHHPQGGQMTLHHCLVSDTEAEEQSFFINLDWSEMSSAVAATGRRHRREETRLPSRSIDAFIPPAEAAGKSVLFKLDIEGFEFPALRGLSRTLEQAANLVGLVEYDTLYTSRAGFDCAEFLDWLRDRFEVYVIDSLPRRRLTPLPGPGRDAAVSDPERSFHTDLVLIGKNNPGGWLPPSWSIDRGHLSR